MIDARCLVIIKTADGVGSGIIISPHGHILTCYHNLYSENRTERQIIDITSVITDEQSPNGRPNTSIINSSQNITIITPEEDLTFARKQDLIVLRAVGLDKRYYAKLSKEHPINHQEVSFLGYDSQQSNAIRCVLNATVLDHYVENRGISPYFRLDSYAFQGMSGGGVFNCRGELIGISRCIDLSRGNEILASFIDYGKIVDWVPTVYIPKENELAISPELFTQLVVILFEVSNTPELRKLYFRAIPKNSSFSSEKAALIIRELAGFGRQSNGTYPIISFVNYAINFLGSNRGQNINPELLKWREDAYQELGIVGFQEDSFNENELEVEDGGNANLLIIIEEGEGDDIFDIRSYIVTNDYQLCRPLTPQKGQTLEECKNNLLTTLYKECSLQVSVSNFIIHFFLPTSLLCQDVNNWLISTNTNRKSPISRDSIVIIRSQERTYKAFSRHWHPKWRIIEKFFKSSPTSINYLYRVKHDLSNSLHEAFDAQVINTSNVNIIVASQPSHNSFEKIVFSLDKYKSLDDIRVNTLHISNLYSVIVNTSTENESHHVLQEAIDSGLAIIVWFREKTYFNDQILEELFSFLRLDSLKVLPSRLLNQRQCTNSDNFVHYLSLLWDDPNILPPDANKEVLFKRPKYRLNK